MYITPTWWELWFDGILLINETGNLNSSLYLDGNSTTEYNIYYGPTVEPVNGNITDLCIETWRTWDWEDEWCDYWNPDETEIDSKQFIDTVDVYENIEISFYMKTESAFTCSDDHCSVFRLGNESGPNVARLPNINIEQNLNLRFSMHLNNGSARFISVSDATFMSTHNGME